jgi:ribosomal protein L35
MGKMKTRKSFLKRFKITKNKKILKKITGQSHGFSKKASDYKRKRRKLDEINFDVSEYLYI